MASHGETPELPKQLHPIRYHAPQNPSFPSPELTLQLINAAVVHTVSCFSLQLFQVLLVLTRRASLKVLYDLIELPQEVTELLCHGWGKKSAEGVV